MFIVVLFAHSGQDGLLRAAAHGAKLLLSPVRNAAPALNSHLGASLVIAPLPRRAMGTAKSRLLHILGAARMRALLPLGSVRNTKPPLDNPVRTAFDSALTPNPLAATTAHIAPIRRTGTTTSG